MRKARMLSLLLVAFLLALLAAAPAYAAKPITIQISGNFGSNQTSNSPFSPCPTGYTCNTITANNWYTGSLTSTSGKGAWICGTAPSGEAYCLGEVTFTGTLTYGGTTLTGTLTWAEVGYYVHSPSFSGTEYWTIIGGTGQLAGIHGYGTNIWGPPAPSYSGTLYLG